MESSDSAIRVMFTLRALFDPRLLFALPDPGVRWRRFGLGRS
ncbi:hypothetical protein [Rhodococcus sp. AW25M09]|nr:hypothetical protein [Rhodococcus sp. AW25M09]